MAILEERAAEKSEVAEALYMFMGWLTTREEHISLGCTADAAPVAQLIGRFIKHNGLAQPRDDWHLVTLLNHPEED